MAIYVKKWNGSAWVNAAVKKWNGSAWVDGRVCKWNGSSWEQIYPDTIVTTSKSLTTTSFNTYRSKWDNNGVAKQGVYSTYKQAHGQFNISAASIPGSGNISSIGSCSFSGTRDGSGNYNNNQTVRFYRSNITGNSSSPVGTCVGEFTGTTGGPGSGKAMSNRAITVDADLKDWTNQVSGKPYLYITSSASADYMGIKTSFTINITNYKYTAKTLSFEGLDEKSTMLTGYAYKEATGKDPYYTIMVYEDEVDMTLAEIIQRREDGIVEPIFEDQIDIGYEATPWTREYYVGTELTREGTSEIKFKIEVLDMRMNDQPQYSLDGVDWFPMTAKYDDTHSYYVEATLPSDYNKYRDSLYFRVLDKETVSEYAFKKIEPLIYLPDQTGGGLILPGEEIELPPFDPTLL